MRFFSKLLEAISPKIQKLENQAHDVLELPKDLKALRVDDDVVIVDSAKNKIIDRFEDKFPSNPARATLQIMKKLKLSSFEEYQEAMNKQSKEIWTCGFREAEDRWVWYKNSEPQMTVAFKEVYPKEDESTADGIEKKIDFCSAKWGTWIIDEIKKNGLKETAEKFHALVLDNPYTEIKCPKCKKAENYTIDDLVDENRMAKYDSNFVVCASCNELIKLV